MADHDELVTLFVQLGHFHMHLGHQRAGGIKNFETALAGFFLHRQADAVGAENQCRTSGHIGQVLNEDGALFFQIVHHIGVVHDLMAHINRAAKFVQRQFDDFNRTVNARTKTARFSQ